MVLPLSRRQLHVWLLATLLCAGTPAAVAEQRWAGWLLEQIESHPEMAAARETMRAQHALGVARGKPLYNPTLESELEREGDFNNYRIGISQTLDLWNKREYRKDQGQQMRAAAEWRYTAILQQKAAATLRAVANWLAARERAQLAREQQSQLQSLATLLRQKRDSGEMGQLDLDLALLSLSRQLQASAQSAAGFQAADAQLRELLPQWSAMRAQAPASLWRIDPAATPENWLDAQPQLQLAQLDWRQLQEQSRLEKLESRGDPTIGINGGRREQDNTLALTFSMPLNIRNRYDDEIRAADGEALSAEAEFRARRRQLLFEAEGRAQVLRTYRAQIELWQSQVAGSGTSSAALLEKHWRNGDLSTTDYLQALQQRRDGLAAASDLRLQYRLAGINWLETTGRVTTHLEQVMR